MSATFVERVLHRLRRRHRPRPSPLLDLRQPRTAPVDERVHDVDVRGVRLAIGDAATSWTAEAVVRDLRADAYDLHTVPFLPGEVVVDLGAHVGVFATFLARLHPSVVVYAVEPVPANFELLCRNVRRNGVPNVVPVNVAVTADGRELDMTVHMGLNTGGATGHRDRMDAPGHTRVRVASVTLDDLLDELGVRRVKLLKIDVEGAEHEILRSARSLDRVEHLRGEFHINGHLEAQGHSIPGLVSHCGAHVDPARIRVVECRMAE